MIHFPTLKEYCKGIRISPPRWEDFDLRSFEENMKTVRHRMPPFKHEFYAIAIKIDGGGFASTGNYDTKDLKTTLFFNSPYQINSWDIAPDWKGFYLIFTEDFYRRTLSRKRITEDFSFLLNDNATPMEVSAEEAELYAQLFSDINFEFTLDEFFSKDIIANYLNILLHKIKRIYDRTHRTVKSSQDHRKSDLDMVSRFKTLLEISFQPEKLYEDSHPHQVQFYAEKLHLHPNHFNSIVKRITDKSASEHIQSHLLALAKSKLRNSNASVKQIAFELYYTYPNHFTNFFKKHTAKTPSQFRKSTKK